MFEHHPNLIAVRGFMVAVCLALLAGCGAGVNSLAAANKSAPAGAPTVPPTAPADLRATPGNAQASLTWSARSGAASYNVKRSTTSGGPYTQLAAATSPSYTDATVSNGTTYYYVVTAVSSGGESADSAQASVAPDPTITTPPVPMGLAATAGNAQVSLMWSASGGATSYHVKRATTSGGPYTQVGAPTSASSTDSSLTNGTKYYYVVSALDSAGESANSAQVSAAPVAPASIAAAPTGLSATPGNTQVILSWSSSSGATSYHVKRATTSGGPYTQVGAPTSASYTDPSLTNGTKYYYVVSALDSAGESANSAQVSAAPVAPAIASPTGLSATPGNAQVALSWSASSGATSYYVERSTTSGGPYTQLATAMSPSYTDTTVSNGTAYYYVVAAVNSAGASAYSAQASASPAAPPPKIVTGCNGLPAVGVWQQITPAGVDLSTFGVTNVNLVPNNTATVYLGSAKSGLFKSVDCGANFVKVNTGTLSSQLSSGAMNALIDPINPNVMYTYSLYGQNGVFKSIDGGINFVSILTPAVAQYAPYGGFVGGYDMDPQNHLHLLISWHQVCSPPYNSACYAETFDGGVTWVMRNGDPSWNGGEGASLNFLDSNRWLFSSASNGMWLSKNQGTTWTPIPLAQVAHGTGQLVRMSDGSFFMAAANGVLHSPDGENWDIIPNSGHLVMGLATDGATIWTSQAFPYNPDQRPAPAQHYWQASTSNPTSWTPMNAPDLSSGGTWLTYDPDHHILYSANYWDGLWRVVTK